MRIEQMLERIQGEFVEMPGLRLTAPQARRLWGLDQDACSEVLRALVNTRFLIQTRDGAFVRNDGASAAPATVRRGPLAAAS